jgi:protein gp37
MAENSGIEWTHHTWNPWVGCTKISPACDHCYAEDWSKRVGRDVWGPHADRQRTKTQGNPIKWNKRLEGTGQRERVFVASLADVFDNHKSIQQEWRDGMWRTIRECKNLDFLLLTKRPQNIKRYLPADWGDGYPNVWLGTTVENQIEADRRIPELLKIDAVVLFLSCEPLLGPVDLEKSIGGTLWIGGQRGCDGRHQHQGRAGHVIHGILHETDPRVLHHHHDERCRKGLDWVITGGESGPGARLMHPKWALSLRDQCKDAEVPFFFKQWGEWAPVVREELDEYGLWAGKEKKPVLEIVQGRKECGYYCDEDHGCIDHQGWVMKRVGKKAAGAHLDGVLHREFPAAWEQPPTTHTGE